MYEFSNFYKISIVVVHKGDIQPLITTLTSIKNRVSLKNFDITEIILVFSGNSINYDYVIKKFDFIRISILNCDNSLYNAMNIGLSLSNGRSIIYINSGDLLLNDPNIDYIEGKCIIYRYVVSSALINGGLRVPKLAQKNICHQAFLAPIENSRQDRIYFDEAEKIYADSLWMQDSMARYGFKRSDIMCSLFWLGGLSTYTSLSRALVNFIYSKFKIQSIKLIFKSLFSSAISGELFIRLLLKYSYINTNIFYNKIAQKITCASCGNANYLSISNADVRSEFCFKVYCKYCGNAL